MAFEKNIQASRIIGLLAEIGDLGGLSGSGTLNYIPKWTPDGVTIGNSLIYDSGTNVGIGTSTPTARLHVKSVNHLSASYAFKIDDDLSNSLFKITNTARTSINNASHNSPLGTDDAIFATQISGYTFQHAANILWLYDNNVKMYNAISSTYGAIGTYTANDFYIRTGNVDRIKIDDSTGYVGIGTSSPTAKLHVVGLLEYTDNADALANGLTIGAFYRTGDLLKVVH